MGNEHPDRIMFGGGRFQSRARHCWLFAWLPLILTQSASAGDWPRWRGPEGNAVSPDAPLPREWDAARNVRWKTPIDGEGASSPIVHGSRVFLTSSREDGRIRLLHCLERTTGRLLWTRSIRHGNPERTSAVTGHAASTPVTDGRHVVAFFGNAGAVCHDLEGNQLWHRLLGEFDTELGLASSPIIHGDRVILVCDHDGTRPTSFDSFLVALDVRTGETIWKTPRPGLERSWSTPILVPAGEGRAELVVCAQDHVRAYDPATGKQLWQVGGLTGWVTPSPVFGLGMVFATSGKNGPIMALRPGGSGDVTSSHVVWKQDGGGPYVCSPLLHGEQLYVHNELGILTCFEARTGKIHYQQRVEGKFTASGVAGDGNVYLTNEQGTTLVIRSGPRYECLARNCLGEYTVASPAIAGGEVLIRTEKHLYCIKNP